jgi:LysM repeat protein
MDPKHSQPSIETSASSGRRKKSPYLGRGVNLLIVAGLVTLIAAIWHEIGQKGKSELAALSCDPSQELVTQTESEVSQEAYSRLLEQHEQLLLSLAEVTSEMEWLREQADRSALQEQLSKAVQARDDLLRQLELTIISRAQEEVELQRRQERIDELESALALESACRADLEQETSYLIEQKELLLQLQETEFSALIQAHEELQRQFSVMSDIAEERATALLVEVERTGTVEEILRAEQEYRLEMEQMLAARNEQRQLLAHLEQTQNDLTERIRGLGYISEVLQQEKRDLEQKVQELVRMAQERERTLQTTRQQADSLVAAQNELERAFGLVSTENYRLIERVTQLEKAEERADLERERRMRGEALYNQLAASLREQQKILSEMERSRNELRHELELLRREQPRLNEGRKVGLSEMPELTFEAPAKRTAPTVQASVPASIVEGETRYHIVKGGETLSQISQRYYGTANRWSQIFEANRDLISDVNRVPVGTRLTIP